MQIVALTGGIASGKSTVAKRLAQHGAIIVDADELARVAVAPGSPGLDAVVRRFGPGVLAPDGALDRAALGSIVFADAQAREDLNAITHPEVWRLARERFSAAEASDPDAVVVYDVPLLVEASAARPLRFDRIVVAHAGHATRLRRLVELRGMSEPEAERRLGAQASDDERLAVADDVIDTAGSMAATLEQADRLWASLRAAR